MSVRRLEQEIRDLSLKAADGRLSDDEQKRLNQLMEIEELAPRMLLEYSLLDADLMFHARAAAAEERVLCAVVGKRRTSQGRRSLRRVAARIGLAVAAAAVAVAFFPQQPNGAHDRGASAAALVAQREPQPIARLTLAPGAVFQGRQLAANALFFEGDEIRLLSGEAHVSMACGADFVLKAPGELHFSSAQRVRLAQGVLTAHVAKWGAGFTVDTDRMRVIDLGTRFAVDASTGDVETHVLQGRVRVQPLDAAVDGRRSVLLSEGQALRVDRGAASATRLDAQQDRFPAADEDFRPFKPVVLSNTGVGLSEGDEDPRWRIAAGPIGAAYHGPQFGVVCTPDERYAPNEPDRSQWISVAKVVRPGALANSVFTYETTFDLAGFDLSTVIIAVQILADNGVRAVRLNGEPVAIEPWDDNVFGQEFTRNRFRMTEIQSGFVPGENELEIDVWNGVYKWSDDPQPRPPAEAEPNPMALRVEFQGFGRLVDNDAAAQTVGATPPSDNFSDNDR